ncbi:MAG TPA: META domain-containing protein [Burkholderiaceae bacterium]|nr:META domain-containing protein [Burkholderiaceae bacterium]
MRTFILPASFFRTASWAGGLGLALVTGCAAPGSPAAADEPPLAGPRWVLVALGSEPAAPGAGGRPADLRFDAANQRAAGFAGCNRYSASYQVEGRTLSLGPAVATKMACAQGGDTERRLLDVLPQVRGWQVQGRELRLHDGQGMVLARFRASE